MIAGNLGNWIEAASLIGFAVANVVGVFVVLYRALGMPDEPQHVQPADRGAMSEAGVPYVPGPPRQHA